MKSQYSYAICHTCGWKGYFNWKCPSLKSLLHILLSNPYCLLSHWLALNNDPVIGHDIIINIIYCYQEGKCMDSVWDVVCWQYHRIPVPRYTQWWHTTPQRRDQGCAWCVSTIHCGRPVLEMWEIYSSQNFYWLKTRWRPIWRVSFVSIV